jgi:hypothetical protein
MLGELDIQAILAQVKDFHAARAWRLRDSHSLLWWASPTDIITETGTGSLPASGILQIPPSPSSRMATLILLMSTDIMVE